MRTLILIRENIEYNEALLHDSNTMKNFEHKLNVFN